MNETICELAQTRHESMLPRFPVIDMHTHFGPLLLGEDYEARYDTMDSVQAMRAAGIEKAVVLELVWDDALDRLLDKLAPAGDFLTVFGSIDVSRAMEPDFERTVYRQIRRLLSRGCRGVKLWKDITLFGKRYYGKNIGLDDKRLDVIYQACGEADLPIVIHVADPPCFFRPIDPMNEHYVCLSLHPEWSFYGKGVPSFEAHMRMQETVIRNNPDTTFVVAHVGSYAENLNQVGRWLDAYPNLYVDIAARLDQLGRQPYTAKAFIERYQDRILFGTDFEAQFDKKRTASFYSTHVRFLETKDEYFDHPFPDMLGQWKIYGLGLDDGVLQKLYYENAARVLGI